MSFAKRLKQARKRQGLTQEELGKKSGLSTYTIQRYEYGKLSPKKDTVAKLATALNLDCNYTESGEAYFHAFPDVEPKQGQTETEKFNKEQYEDAIENILNEYVVLTSHYPKISEFVKKLENSEAYIQIEKNTEPYLMKNTADRLRKYHHSLILSQNYHALNEQGQEKLYNYSCDLLEIPKYRADTTPEHDDTTPDDPPSSNQEEPTKN